MRGVLCGIVLLLSFNFCLAQDIPGKIQRTEEVISKEEGLRKKVEEPRKFYICQIMVEGATLLSEDIIKQIILPFKKAWLTEAEIQQILGLFKQAYQQQGHSRRLKEITYEIKARCLKVKVSEQP